MYQIDVATAATTQPASTTAGTAGFFTDGNPASATPATIVPAEFLNSMMVEMLNVLTDGSVTPVKSSFTNLRDAIRAMIAGPTKWQGYGAWLAADQTLATATWTKLALATQDFQQGTGYVTGTARFTPTVAGFYDISATADLKTTVDQTAFVLGAYVNGTLNRTGAHSRASGTGHVGASLTTKVYLNGTTDYLEIWAYQDSGASKLVDSTASLTHVQVLRIA